MTYAAIRNHALLLLAVLAGIVGMGMVFDAAMGGSVPELTVGMPVLMIGLWWSGHELGRSTFASRAKKARRLREQETSSK